VEARGVEAVLLGRATGDGVEPDVLRPLPLEEPVLAAVVVGEHLRGAVPVLRRDVPLEHVRRLDDVVVDTDEDEVFDVHPAPPLGLLDGSVRLSRAPPPFQAARISSTGTTAPSSRNAYRYRSSWNDSGKPAA